MASIVTKQTFDVLRKFHKGHLNETRFAGYEAILNACHKHNISSAQIPYVLATAYHETGGTLKPIREACARYPHWDDRKASRAIDRYFRKVLSKSRYRRKKKYWLKNKRTGQYYIGKGLPQITWYANYKKFQDILGVALVKKSDLALVVSISAEILVYGMKHAVFSGNKGGLNHYIKRGTLAEYKNARRLVNGTDKALSIAKMARRYKKALSGVKIFTNFAGELDKNIVSTKQKRFVQRALNGLGYNVGAVDGDIGAKSIARIAEYRKAHNLGGNGISKSLVNHLKLALAQKTKDVHVNPRMDETLVGLAKKGSGTTRMTLGAAIASVGVAVSQMFVEATSFMSEGSVSPNNIVITLIALSVGAYSYKAAKRRLKDHRYGINTKY